MSATHRENFQQIGMLRPKNEEGKMRLLQDAHPVSRPVSVSGL